MSEEIKPGKKLKTGVRIKTKPAVVPTRRKVKTKGAKLPIAMMGPKGIRKWNIIFTIIFGALLVLTVINSFFREFIIIPIPDLYLQVIIPIVIFIEVFLVLLAFETYKVSFAFRLLRIILTIITALVFFPLTLIKYHTRHNIWRIMFVGLTIGTLILSFFSPYINMIGKYRDLPPGDITEQEVSPDWFSSLFQGSAPFYIDGLLDLLDALDLNDTLGDQEMATVDSSTALGNYLYRWEINDRYDSGTWEFTASNAQQFSLEPEDFGSPPAAWVQELNVTQTVYSSAFSTAILGPLLSTWSTYHTPHLEPVSDYDSYLRDSNDSVAAESGSTSISFNSRDQLLLQSTATSIAFLGTYNYQTYFALDDIQAVIGEVEDDHSLDGFGTTTFNDTYAAYLQEPQNYRTVSPSVATYATTRKNEGFVANSNTVYEQIIFVLDDIIQRFGLPLEAQSDNEGADRAERLILGYDRSVSAYIALAVMALRICGIPARPVFGFAIGDDIGGDPTSKSLTLANLFGWVEALLPLDQGGPIEYEWGQFQLVPYPYGGDLVYCENTLYSAYNVSISMLGDPPGYDALPTYDVGGEDVYLTDYDTPYTLRAIVTTDGSPISGVSVNFESISVGNLTTYQSNPTQLLDAALNVGSDTTNIGGIAEYFVSLDSTNYTMFNPTNPNPTTYVIIAYVSLSNLNGTSFIVLPEGYLSDIEINATKQTLPNPQNPLETFNYFIVQKGFTYQLSTLLYEDDLHTTPKVGGVVSYYILTQTELQQLQLGLIGPEDLTKIGDDVSAADGNTTVLSDDGITDYFDLPIDTTYFIVATFGQNYTFTVILLIDEIKSTVDIDSSDLLNFDLDFYLYFQPFLGSPDPIQNEPIEVWIAPETAYSSYAGSDSDALKALLSDTTPGGENETAPYSQIVATGITTDASGFYNSTFLVNKTNYGVGTFLVIVFYQDKWNVSTTFIISGLPALSISEMNEEAENTIKINDKKIFNLLHILCVIAILGNRKKVVLR